ARVAVRRSELPPDRGLDPRSAWNQCARGLYEGLCPKPGQILSECARSGDEGQVRPLLPGRRRAHYLQRAIGRDHHAGQVAVSGLFQRHIRPVAIAAVPAMALAAIWHGVLAGRAETPMASCNEFLLQKNELPGVSHQSCRMIETDVTYLGLPYRRVDMGITGTIDGMTAKDGPRTNYFTQSPEFVFAQTGNKAPLHHGV